MMVTAILIYLKQNRFKLAIINLAEYNIHMHEIKVQNVFLCTNPEKVPSVSEANRHFMWIVNNSTIFWS